MKSREGGEEKKQLFYCTFDSTDVKNKRGPTNRRPAGARNEHARTREGTANYATRLSDDPLFMGRARVRSQEPLSSHLHAFTPAVSLRARDARGSVCI